MFKHNRLDGIARFNALTDITTTFEFGMAAKITLLSSTESEVVGAGTVFLFITRTIMYLFSHVGELATFQPCSVMPYP
jgi:hypothetical protein